MNLPDCLSLQNCTETAQVRAATEGRRRQAKADALRLINEQLSSTVVEIRLDVLSEILELATEAQEAREARARRSAAAKSAKPRTAEGRTEEVDSLIQQGLSAQEIVERLALPRTYLGPIGAKIKRYKESGR